MVVAFWAVTAMPVGTNCGSSVFVPDEHGLRAGVWVRVGWVGAVLFS